MCSVSLFPFAVGVLALGFYTHCRMSLAAEISVVTAGQRMCQKAQEINGTAAMLMFSLIMEPESEDPFTSLLNETNQRRHLL